MTRTVRILSLDGGGMRGYLSATFLKSFVDEWGAKSEELYKHFDIITGTSVGGIQAMGYSLGKTPTLMQQFFREDGPWIFTTSATTPGVRATTLDKVQKMVFGGSFYKNQHLKDKLLEEFGDKKILDAKTNVLLTSYAKDTDTPVLFSNVDLPDFSGKNLFIRDTTLATGSAPLYFPTADFNGHNYIDGGVFQNNPAMLGYAMAKSLYPMASKICLLSVGTGLADIGFHEPTFRQAMRQLVANQKAKQSLSTISNQQLADVNVFENMYLLMDLISMEITAPQEAVNKQLQLMADFACEEFYYYRFQYLLDKNQDNELDNSSTEYLNYLEKSALEHFASDILNITRFIGHMEA